MDERSSKYVDQITLQKLLEDKLEQVSHPPDSSDLEFCSDLFTDFDSLSPDPGLFTTVSPDKMVMKSPVESQYSENNSVEIIHYPSCPDHEGQSKGNIVFYHGLYEANRDIYSFLIQGLNRQGFHVYLATLPYHYHRKPESALFGGEYFWSAKISRTRCAFKQAVYELYQIYHYIRTTSSLPASIAGFSMGGSVALMLASIDPGIDRLFVVNPATGFSDVVHTSPLFKTIREDFFGSGYTLKDLQQVFKPFEPISVTPPPRETDHICLGYALYDQVIDQDQHTNIIKAWNLSHVIEYKAGHLNVLRVPKLAADIARFFDPAIITYSQNPVLSGKRRS